MTIQSVSKLDAATRQLNVAIVLYFQDADPLGVHTVAGAAHGLLEDLIARRGGESSVRARDQSETLAFLSGMIIKAKNFLKHADRDPDHVLTFDPGWTDFLMFDAIRMHIELARRLSRQDVIFLLWLSAKYPNVPLLDNLVGDGIGELRRLFPALGGIDAKKRTFLAALNSEPPAAPPAE
jgi:hypothetical protein